MARVQVGTLPFVSGRTLGDVRASVIAVGSFHMAPRRYSDEPGMEFPHTPVDATGRVRADLCALYLEAGGHRILIDPGHFEPGEETGLPDLRLTPGVEAGLRTLGVEPDAIDLVVLTHGHFDHCSGVLRSGDGGETTLRFPNATHLLHSEDWHPDGGLDPEWHAQVLRYMQPVHDAGRLRLVDEAEFEVCDGVTLVHAPGETPGHSILRVQTDAGPLYYLGDLVHLPGEARRIDWAAGSHERDELTMVASRRRFLDEVASSAALAVFAHAVFPAWGAFEAVGPDEWQWGYAP